MIILDLDEINRALARFTGGGARFWFFSVSLTRLLIRITHQERDTELGLFAGNCSTMSGPFSWTVSALSVVAVDGRTRIEDGGAAFVLDCATCALVERDQIPSLSSLDELQE